VCGRGCSLSRGVQALKLSGFCPPQELLICHSQPSRPSPRGRGCWRKLHSSALALHSSVLPLRLAARPPPNPSVTQLDLTLTRDQAQPSGARTRATQTGTRDFRLRLLSGIRTACGFCAQLERPHKCPKGSDTCCHHVAVAACCRR
jgi:hypothetical protein